MRFTQWRDSQAWRDCGLELSTTSNEACKLYDAAVAQYVCWYEDASIGGLEKSVENCLKADPNFVMGHVLSNGLDLMGTSTSLQKSPAFKARMENMKQIAGKANLNPREKLHLEAIDKFALGDTSGATQLWEEILIDNPTDMLAIKFSHDTYFYLGYQAQMRDSLARVLPHWKESMPLYGYLMGMYSFGLVETNLYDQAEKVAKKGLELNPDDPWSTHSTAHVYEMTGRYEQGINFMSSTVKDWSPGGMLACHNYWHWGLYNIEKGDYSAALGIYDTEIGVRCKSGAMLDIVDACSFLYRLQMEDQNIGDRWNDVYEICRPHIDDHILAFNDVHILMSLLGAKKTDTVFDMIESLSDYVRDGSGTNWGITRDIGAQLMNALVAYDDGNYDGCVAMLKPLKYDIVQIGGSNAQRDLFNLFFIHAAMKSPLKEDQKLARNLLAERKAMKENSPMTDRLVAKAMAIHMA